MRLDAPTLFFSVGLYAIFGALVVALLRRRLPRDTPGLKLTATALVALALFTLPIALSLLAGKDHARLHAALNLPLWVATAALLAGILDFRSIAYDRRRYWLVVAAVAVGFLGLAVAGCAPRWRIALFSGATSPLVGFAGWKLLRLPATRPNLGLRMICWVMIVLSPLGVVRATGALLDPGFHSASPSAMNIFGLLSYGLFIIGIVFSCILMVSDILVERERAANVDLSAERERQAAIVLLLEDAREAAQSASREKTRFLAMTSHEIRTPLYGVLGLADLLGDTRLDATQTDYLRRMKLTGEHLLSLITSVLDLAKIEEGRVDVGHSPFSLRVVVDQVHDGLRTLAESKLLHLSWHVDSAVPEWVVGDRVKVGQVLTNLVGNAIKFTAQGSVRTRIELAGRYGERIRFRIVDTGPGVASDELRDLFRPFGRRSDSEVPGTPGIGLGLAISQSLVAAMGGEIGVESKVGTGAAFWFSLPLPRAGTPRDPFVPQTRSGPLRLAGNRALVVEDDETSALILRHWLGALSLSVTVTSDGAEALELAKTGEFLLLVLDRQLPSLDGIELGRRIRAHERLTAKEPALMVLCTAHALRDVAEEALASGFDQVITKPFDRVVFETLVGELEMEASGTG